MPITFGNNVNANNSIAGTPRRAAWTSTASMEPRVRRVSNIHAAAAAGCARKLQRHSGRRDASNSRNASSSSEIWNTRMPTMTGMLATGGCQQLQGGQQHGFSISVARSTKNIGNTTAETTTSRTWTSAGMPSTAGMGRTAGIPATAGMRVIAGMPENKSVTAEMLATPGIHQQQVCQRH